MTSFYTTYRLPVEKYSVFSIRCDLIFNHRLPITGYCLKSIWCSAQYDFHTGHRLPITGHHFTDYCLPKTSVSCRNLRIYQSYSGAFYQLTHIYSIIVVLFHYINNHTLWILLSNAEFLIVHRLNQ